MDNCFSRSEYHITQMKQFFSISQQLCTQKSLKNPSNSTSNVLICIPCIQYHEKKVLDLSCIYISTCSDLVDAKLVPLLWTHCHLWKWILLLFKKCMLLKYTRVIKWIVDTLKEIVKFPTGFFIVYFIAPTFRKTLPQELKWTPISNQPYVDYCH